MPYARLKVLLFFFSLLPPSPPLPPSLPSLPPSLLSPQNQSLTHSLTHSQKIDYEFLLQQLTPDEKAIVGQIYSEYWPLTDYCDDWVAQVLHMLWPKLQEYHTIPTTKYDRINDFYHTSVPRYPGRVFPSTLKDNPDQTYCYRQLQDASECLALIDLGPYRCTIGLQEGEPYVLSSQEVGTPRDILSDPANYWKLELDPRLSLSTPYRCGCGWACTNRDHLELIPNLTRPRRNSSSFRAFDVKIRDTDGTFSSPPTRKLKVKDLYWMPDHNDLAYLHGRQQTHFTNSPYVKDGSDDKLALYPYSKTVDLTKLLEGKWFLELRVPFEFSHTRKGWLRLLVPVFLNDVASATERQACLLMLADR